MSSKLLEILFAFGSGRRRLTLADLARITGMHHATVRRLVLELVEVDALDRAEDGSFTIGIRLWQLGTLAPLSVPLRTVALPVMEDLHTTLREHVQLAVREGTRAVIVERLSGPHAVSVDSQVGGHLPLHSSGVGKVLLAHAPPDVVARVIDRGLPRLTPRTITDPNRLAEVLAECRRTGVATVHEETSVSADSVATRIMDAEGNVIGSLSVVVRSGSVNFRNVMPSVITSGLSISRRLGWTPMAGVRLPEEA